MKSPKGTFTPGSGCTPLQTIPCRYFAFGTCKYGDDCLYAHPQPTVKVPLEELTALHIDQPPISDSRRQKPCRFFASGNCARGQSCSFAHAGKTERLPTATDDFDEPDDGDTGTRELGGAVVQFGDGATVSTVSLRTEFSSFRFKFLPADMTPETVVSLLDAIGVVAEPGFSAANPIYSIADIALAESLSQEEMRIKIAPSPELKGAQVTGIPSRAVRSSNIHTIDCRRVHCSWYRPVCTAWLNFGSQDIARRVSRGFQTGRYKIASREATASEPTGQANTYNHQAFTVTLTNLPPLTTKKQINDGVGRNCLPRHIEISKPSYREDEDTAIARVQSLLTGIGKLEGAPIVSRSALKRLKIQAKFLHETDARTAAAKLNNSVLPFYSKGKLTVQLVISAKFKVLNRMYQAVEQHIEAHKPRWTDLKVFLRVYPPSAAFTCLKLEGQDTKQVASAKKDLDNILAGHIIKKDEGVVWSEAWGKMKNLSRLLKPVEEDFDVFIWRDTLRRQLRAYGAAKNCERAAERLAGLAHQGDALPFEIHLSQEDFRWVCQCGHDELSLALGGASVAIDVVSTPKRVLIHGNREDYEKGLALFQGTKRDISKVAPPSSKDCSACWTEAESPIRTQCGHIYCTGCFENLCSSKSTTDVDTAIRCVGAEDTCKRIFPLSELQEHLSSATLEDVLGASFSSYIARNPTGFRYCPTPDCGTIYRVAKEEAKASLTHTCEKCLVRLCTSCHVSHENQSCGEYKSQLPDPELAILKKKLGIKDCPKCKTSMEKTEGCDHMTCQGCSTHICWKCLETFKSARDCYDHLVRIHGDIMDVPDGL